jgi:hypothetical protein
MALRPRRYFGVGKLVATAVFLGFEAVADAPDGGDPPGLVGVGFDLAAEPVT